jgi:hypothetical protein
MQKACEEALVDYEEARLPGLCHKGAWESAVKRLQGLKPAELLEQWQEDDIPFRARPGFSSSIGDLRPSNDA